MLTLLCAVIGTSWGQQVTLDFTTNSWNLPTSNTTGLQTYTSGDYSIKLYASTAYSWKSSGYLLFGKTDSYIELPAFDFDVEKIEFVGNSAASASTKMNVFVGDVAVSTETTGSQVTNTYVIAESYQAAGNVYKIKVTSSHNAQVTYIKIYKKEGPTDKYYVAGSWTDPEWAGGKIQMTKKSDGTYTLVCDQELAAAVQFKIIKEAPDGTTTWYGGEGNDNYWVTVDNHKDITLVSENGKNFYIDVAGTWTFTVDPTGDTPKLTVGGWPEWEYYLLGDFNEWATTSIDSYKFSDAGLGKFTLNKPIKYGEKFKIYGKRGNEEKWFGAVSNGDFYVNAEYVDTELSLTTENGGENFYMNLSNKKSYWTLEFDPENMTLVLGNYLSDIAELPFEFDGGRNDIQNTAGLTTTTGLGDDYNNSPKLQFKATSQELVLHFDERPGTLSFDIKGNSFSGGSFEVLTSENGEVYTVLKTYTTLSQATTGQHEVFENLGENVRYIKWLYKQKSSGNVALGNIKLEKYVAPQSYTLTIDPGENG
jgi:hypothetical protein